MNTFGRLLRLSILGESHGECVGIVIDGCPAGIKLAPQDFLEDMQRRAGGKAVGTTSRAESDEPQLKSGFFNGATTGAPLYLEIPNRDARSKDYDHLKDTPRPGHADFVAQKKFAGFNDHRGGGHFSGRLTAALVAAGVVAKKLIAPINVEARLIEVAGSTEIESVVALALREGDSVGGIVECKALGLPVGLGEPFFDSIESVLSHAVFSIPAIKGIEFGLGFKSASLRGSEVNDPIVSNAGRTSSNNAGGINGGLSNGNPLIFRVAVKPPSSISKGQTTLNLKSEKLAEMSVTGRHDACIALRVPPVLEAVTALVLADLMLISQKIPCVVGAD